MRNAIFSSVSPHHYNFGNNEIQMPNFDIPMQVDSLVTNVHRNSSFSMDSKIFKDHENNQQQLRGGGGFSVSCQSLFNYQQGDFQSFSTSCDDIISHQSFLLSHKRPLPPFELDFQSLQNAIEVNDFLPQEAITDFVYNQRTPSNVCKKNQNKKMKTSSGGKWTHDDHHHIKDPSTELLQEQMVPVRRSQKLSDKITTLQKLVSPYGKTDTASVLQEANLYIKLLQEQIQILCSSYNSVTTPHSQEMGEEKSDLRSRGLCLVPISVTQKLTKNQELLIDSHSMSRKTTMP
ncbi:hypothetical protein ACOSP7_032625 [Xanthoceras sorbifolium]